MTEHDARAVAELISAVVGATLTDMRLSGASRERMQRYVETVSNAIEGAGSDDQLRETFRPHLALVAQIIPQSTDGKR